MDQVHLPFVSLQLLPVLFYLSVDEFEALFIKISQSKYSGKYSFMSDLTQENAIAFYQEDTDLRMKAQSQLVHDSEIFTTGKLFLENPFYLYR